MYVTTIAQSFHQHDQTEYPSPTTEQQKKKIQSVHKLKKKRTIN